MTDRRTPTERRDDAVAAYHGTERRIGQRRIYSNARVNHWLARFHAAKAAHSGASL